MRTLAQIPLHEKTKVLGIVESELKPKLLEMGLYPGKEVEVLFKAPFGDPIAIRVGEYKMSLRMSDAVMVDVNLKQI